MSARNPAVEALVARAEKWRDAFAQLREIALDCGLAEELKWGKPCYSLDKGNIVLIHGFKDYCALLFFKGALLGDPEGVLVQQTENVQAARQMRFRNTHEVESLREVIGAYVKQAIEIERSGQTVSFKPTSAFSMSEEFQKRLDASAPLKAAFSALTPGRQRAYLLNFSAPKQAKTREARIEKNIPRILAGKGLDD